jgi:hypothetical protein
MEKIRRCRRLLKTDFMKQMYKFYFNFPTANDSSKKFIIHIEGKCKRIRKGSSKNGILVDDIKSYSAALLIIEVLASKFSGKKNHSISSCSKCFSVTQPKR